MRPNFLLLAAICAFTGVALGAFGAHGLKAIVTPEYLAVYKTGVTYQLWHALGLALIAILHTGSPGSRLLFWAGCLMFSGILIFSGSLYLLVLLNLKWLGIITPFGGLAFLSAWLLLCIFAYQQRQPTDL